MGSQRFAELSFVVLLVIVGFHLGCCNGYNFYVGGRDGWVLNPSENYTQWAHRNRFQVNDTLFFKYKKGSDSVLLVKKEDFNSCNTTSPIQSLTDGDSTFVFDHSGPFYFISGNSDNCNKGQKLHIVVMAVRPKTSSPTVPSSSSPISSSPAGSPSESPMGSDGSELAPPQHSGSDSFTGLFKLVLCASLVVSVVLGSFIGVV